MLHNGDAIRTQIFVDVDVDVDIDVDVDVGVDVDVDVDVDIDVTSTSASTSTSTSTNTFIYFRFISSELRNSEDSSDLDKSSKNQSQRLKLSFEKVFRATRAQKTRFHKIFCANRCLNKFPCL